jgi:hypothetical protein
VLIGGCRVVAQVDAKMVKPPPERPFEGIITIHAEISPMASPDYEPGRSVFLSFLIPLPLLIDGINGKAIGGGGDDGAHVG